MLLSALSDDARLVIRRPNPVHPQAWLVEGDSRRMQVASTPVLILGAQKVKIGLLKNYDVTQKRPPRQTKTANEPPYLAPLALPGAVVNHEHRIWPSTRLCRRYSDQ